ncbi:hypothetical protein [Wohlfahrtiimonas populi]|uniref:hypothetical protein n=1 Tax=Wohlfahrtiimonas populi TaxID=1940240 RepID=UPI00098CF255|nr:hypothetical protein [Wohlfahrtiimonas populi]
MKDIKKIVLIFLIFLELVYISVAENKTIDKIDFAGVEYSQAYENSDAKVNVVEFLPKGEDLNSFKSMVSYWEQKTITVDKMDGYLSYLAQNTKEPILSTTIAATKDEKKNEYYLEKLITSGNITEYAMYRFMVKNGHLTYYVFSERIYKKPSTEWFESLEKQRVERFKAINEL